MLKPEPGRRTLTNEEIQQSLEKLTKADKYRLEEIADLYSNGLAISGKDLLQTAFIKALSLERKCPDDVPVMAFLIRSMESFVHSYLKKRCRDPLEQAMLSTDEEAQAAAIENIANLDEPAELLQAKQTAQAIEKAFADGDTDSLVLVGQLDGMTSEEIQNDLGLTSVQYASALKSIRRKRAKLIEEPLK